MIHIESASSASLSSSLYTLGHVLDVWGERLTSTRFGPYSGVVHIFTARTPFGQTLTGPWTAYTGTTPRSIPLYSHTAIWIEIGANYVPASRLPQIYFYTQY